MLLLTACLSLVRKLTLLCGHEFVGMSEVSRASPSVDSVRFRNLSLLIPSISTFSQHKLSKQFDLSSFFWSQILLIV